jgi:hypothetical protein
MRQGNIASYISYFLLFFLLQILLFRNAILFQYAICLVYIGYVLTLPISFQPIPLMGISFIFGLIIDSFFDTVGVNAFACVFIAYIRGYIIKILTPAGGYDASAVISIPFMGFTWFVKYAALLTFTHHFIFFLLESWDLSNFFSILLRTFFSSIFTLSVLVILQYLLNRSRK